ncbi:iron chelate uptake ABC transporter family permease subunit [Marinomonas aquiplantarum]|uniref:Iron complex transport system permease protein n=1 Tax=Marinomonas aquiplantarum TaxID=491951 RepID=A0A366CUL8_9GAMM|nr:iron chelate uptake ABC transporter family permease subunit [Marinomonas aquiplantarum]RBO78513.1 iron complex transport system permease protein [Marinomonas aquiplantarum]
MRPFSYWLLALLSLLMLALVSLLVGAYAISLEDIFRQPDMANVMMSSRIPRTLAVLIVGSILGIVGCLSQSVMNNVFAEPTTLGTPQGIALGLLLTSVFLPEVGLVGTMLLGAGMGLLSLLVFFALLQKLTLSDPLQLPLIGLVYSAIWGAGVTFLAFEFDRMQMLAVWLNGDFATIIQGRYELLWGAFIIGLIVYWMANQFSMLGMGEALAKTLGVPYRALVVVALMMIALATSLVVATVGMISFLGLVIPNIVRQYCGDNLKHSLPWCAWMGASSLLLCDVIGRLLTHPLEVPANLVFAVFAGTVFLVMLWRGDRRAF